MWLPVFLAVLGSTDVAPSEREVAVIAACETWRTGREVSTSPAIHRVAADGLCFDGIITAESSAEFVEAVGTLDASQPVVVVLTSGGGEVNAGMDMGEALIPLSTTVVAHRMCASSCANYPFLAGDRRLVGEGSLLAYHGGIPDTPEQYWTELRAEWSQRMTPQEVEQSIEASRAAAQVQVDRQDAFLESVEVDVDLFRWMASLGAEYVGDPASVCPVNDAKAFVFSEAKLAQHGVVIHQNGGPKSDADLETALAAQGRAGVACYVD